METVSRALVVFLLLFSAFSRASDLEGEAKAMVERSNQRCDDFYRYRRDLDEKEAQREKAAQEIKEIRAAHDETIEAARQEYVKNRKKMLPDPRLEKDWDEQSKGWIEANKLEGRRYAERKAKADAIARRGCRVPEMKEYDLED